MKVLITGGAGFIGANLVRALSDGPDNDIVVLDDLSFGFRSNLDGLNVAFIEGSILDEENTFPVNPDVVVQPLWILSLNIFRIKIATVDFPAIT